MTETETAKKPVEKADVQEPQVKSPEPNINLVDQYKAAPTDLFKPKDASQADALKNYGSLQLQDSQKAGERAEPNGPRGERSGESLPPQSERPLTEREQQSKRLLDAAEASKPGSAVEIRRQMEQFERAAKERGLSDTEVAKTYREVSRLYEAKDNPNVPITDVQRRALAKQVLEHAADPTSIDQGAHNTCNVTTLESRAYSRTPSEAARIVADVATTGQYTSRSGLTVKLDKDSMTAHNGAESLHKVDGTRDFAGQLFQVTAVNLAYQKDNPNIRYEQKPPQPGKTPPDNGERLLDYSTNPPTEVGRPSLLFRAFGSEDKGKRQPDLYTDNLRSVGNEITGEKDDKWLLDYGNVKSREDFDNQLTQAKREGRLPLVVMVHTGNEPFHTDSGNGTAGGSGGWHVVNVTDYQAGPPARVAVDNQWGQQADRITPNRQVSPDMLYYSMKEPTDSTQAREMAERARQQKSEGNYDERFQLEALRKQKLTGELTDERYLYMFKAAIKGFDGLYKSGSVTAPDGSWENRINHMNAMPISSQIQILNDMRSRGTISEETFRQNALSRFAQSEALHTAKGNNPFAVRLQMKTITDNLPAHERDAFRLQMLAATARSKRS